MIRGVYVVYMWCICGGVYVVVYIWYICVYVVLYMLCITRHCA